MTIHDILEAIRSKSYLTPADIHFAIVETNGNVSVIPKSASAPATLGDLSIDKPQPIIPFTLICEGKKLQNNIDESGLPSNVIDNLLAHHQLRQKDVLLLSVTTDDEYYLQPIHAPYIVGNLSEVTQ